MEMDKMCSWYLSTPAGTKFTLLYSKYWTVCHVEPNIGKVLINKAKLSDCKQLSVKGVMSQANPYVTVYINCAWQAKFFCFPKKCYFLPFMSPLIYLVFNYFAY